MIHETNLQQWIKKYFDYIDCSSVRSRIYIVIGQYAFVIPIGSMEPILSAVYLLTLNEICIALQMLW